VIRKAKFAGPLRKKQENRFDARIAKVRSRMARKIHKRAGDRVRSKRAHGVAADADMFRIHFADERANAFFEPGQRIQHKRNVPRTALPERGLFQSLANGFQKVDVLFAGISAPDDRIIVRGLERDVTVRCPVPGQSLAARLRTAGAVGKNTMTG
jgi:hypothetical protein